MSARTIRHPAGIATPLLSGGYLIDFGDAHPTFTPDRDGAKAALAARTQTTAMRRDRGEAGARPRDWAPTAVLP